MDHTASDMANGQPPIFSNEQLKTIFTADLDISGTFKLNIKKISKLGNGNKMFPLYPGFTKNIFGISRYLYKTRKSLSIFKAL